MVKSSLRNHLLLLILFVLGSSEVVLAQRSSDKVQAVGAAPFMGSIKKITATEVVISVNGRDHAVSANEVANVAFANEPDALAKARRSVISGQYENAIKGLKGIDKSAVRDDRVKRDIMFYQALAHARLALAGASDLRAAGKMMHQFKKVGSDSHHYYEAIDVLGRLAMSMGQYKAATSYFSELGNAPWREYQLKANVLGAEALLLQKKFAEAREQYQKAVNAEVTGAVVDHQKSLAGIGLSMCLAETGQADQGVSALVDILKKTGPQDIELNAKAYNALGNCYLQQKKVKQALLAFLHTDLLYRGQRDAHAEALFHLTKLWEQVDKSGRARQARNTLKMTYPGSSWAKQI